MEGEEAPGTHMTFPEEDYRKEYIGEVRDGIPHGQGTLTVKAGNT